MNIAGLVKVAKQQAKLGRSDLVQLYIDEIPIAISKRYARTRMGFFQNAGTGDVGRILINTCMCNSEAVFLDTLYHELAHAIAHWVHGREVDTHGPKWKAVMVSLGQKPDRCG